MKRRYKTLKQKRKAWYYNDEYVKAFYLTLAVICLAGLYALTYYAAG